MTSLVYLIRAPNGLAKIGRSRNRDGDVSDFFARFASLMDWAAEANARDRAARSRVE